MKKYFSLQHSERQNVPCKKSWDWHPCRLTLEQIIDRSTVFWNTSPTAKLFLTNKNNMPEECGFSIRMEKMFCYNSNLAWFWYKSWILPEITVDIECRGMERGDAKLKDVYVHLYVTKVTNLDSSIFITDIGVQGNSVLKAQIGRNALSTLKFNSTSFNHSNSKFNILVMVVRRTQEKPMICDVLASFLSPPIFVQSRRTIQKPIDQKNHSKFYSLFEPAHFDKLYYKKKNGGSEPIQNKLQDLLNYFTAPNIRNKIWNPLFLCYKFSYNLIAFYNTCMAENYAQLIEKLFQQFQRFRQTGSESKSTHKSKVNFDKVYPKTLLCIQVNDASQQEINKLKKIVFKLDVGENQVISFVLTEQLLNSKFKRISDLENLRYQYQKFYKRQGLEEHSEQPEDDFDVKQEELRQGSKFKQKCFLEQAGRVEFPPCPVTKASHPLMGYYPLNSCCLMNYPLLY